MEQHARRVGATEALQKQHVASAAADALEQTRASQAPPTVFSKAVAVNKVMQVGAADQTDSPKITAVYPPGLNTNGSARIPSLQPADAPAALDGSDKIANVEVSSGSAGEPQNEVPDSAVSQLSLRQQPLQPNQSTGTVQAVSEDGRDVQPSSAEGHHAAHGASLAADQPLASVADASASQTSSVPEVLQISSSSTSSQAVMESAFEMGAATSAERPHTPSGCGKVNTRASLHVTTSSHHNAADQYMSLSCATHSTRVTDA